jgi:hypothetical protein
LQNYFISVNENLKNLIKKEVKKAAKPLKHTTYGVGWTSVYLETKVEPEVGPEEPDFEVMVDPLNL